MSSIIQQQFDAAIDGLIVEHSLERSTFFVAFSGGMDSCVLLNLMASYALQHPAMRLHALHYNHGLQTVAQEWELFSEKIARKLEVTFQSFKGNVDIDKSQGVESSARQARYQWCEKIMLEVCSKNSNLDEGKSPCQAVLLTAHHADDQAETILINILRGTGLKGLRGIAGYKNMQNYTLVRPLLEFGKRELKSYAEQQQLEWIEDPSNQDVYFKRNAIRHYVMPELNKIRNESAQQFVKLSHHVVDAENILHEVAGMDLSLTQLFDFCPLDRSYGLGFQGLKQLSVSRQLNAIRYWLDSVGYPAESEMDLLKVLDWSINGTSSGAELRRGYRSYRYYRDTLYVMPSQSFASESLAPKSLDTDDFKMIVWKDISRPLAIDSYQAIIKSADSQPELSKDAKLGDLIIKQRDQADSILLTNSSKHINPKNCLQEAGVPPWRRNDALFVVDQNNHLVDIVGGQNIGKFICVSSL